MGANYFSLGDQRRLLGRGAEGCGSKFRKKECSKYRTAKTTGHGGCIITNVIIHELSLIELESQSDLGVPTLSTYPSKIKIS